MADPLPRRRGLHPREAPPLARRERVLRTVVAPWSLFEGKDVLNIVLKGQLIFRRSGKMRTVFGQEENSLVRNFWGTSVNTTTISECHSL